MLEALGKVFDLFKIPTRYVIAAFCVFLGLWYWKKGYPYTDIALLLAAIVLLGRCLGWASKVINTFRFNRMTKKSLQSLTVAEKEILRQYIESQTDTISLCCTDVVAGLERRKILRLASSAGYGYSPDQMFYRYFVDSYARKYLDKHRGLIGL